MRVELDNIEIARCCVERMFMEIRIFMGTVPRSGI